MGNVIANQSAKATIISYLGATLGFITTFFILTKVLSPEEIGLTRIILEVATLVSSIGLIGLTSSIYRFFPYFKDNNQLKKNTGDIVHRGFFFYITIIALIGLIISSILYVVFKPNIADLFHKNSALYIKFYYTVIPLTFFLGFWTIFELYTIQLLKIVVPKFIREVVLRILLLLVYILYALNIIDLQIMIYLYVCVYGISMLLCLAYLRKLIPINLKHNNELVSSIVKKEFYLYTSLYTIGSLGTVLSSRMDLFMVSSIDKGGLTSAGVYTIAFYMVAVLEIPSRVIMAMSTPSLAESMKDNDITKTKSLFHKVALYELLTSMFLFVVVWVSIDSIFGIMPNGGDYISGKWIFFFLGIAKLVELVFNFGGAVVSCSKYYHWNIYYTVGTTIIAFFANLYLIPYYGTKGAAIATLITISMSYGIQQIFISRKIKVSPFSYRLLILLIIGIVSVFVGYLLPSVQNNILNIILRSGIISIIFSILIIASKIAPEAIDFIYTTLVKLGIVKKNK